MVVINDGKNINFIGRTFNWLGGWSLSRTFELSTGQAVLEDKVERLEMQVRLMDEKMDEMFDVDEEIMKQNEDLFKKLQQSNTGYSYN